MRKSSVVLTVLIACVVILETSVAAVAADDAAVKKKPAKSKWVQAMEKTFKTLDKDEDGFLTFDEYKGQRKRPKAIFWPLADIPVVRNRLATPARK